MKRFCFQGNYAIPSLDATGKDMIVIGGGDTGVDCIGTSLRQVNYTEPLNTHLLATVLVKNSLFNRDL
jgi:hypothetical protein